MKIIVVGCGKIGTSIIENLVNEGHDVIAVDSNPQAVAAITDVYDVMCVVGNGADCDTLQEADVDKTEMVVAVTGSDEMNMLCCFMAKRMGAGHTIARIRNPEYNDKSLSFMRQQLDLSLSINPELLTAQEIFNQLRLPSAINVEPFSRRNFEMLEIRLRSDSPMAGIPLTDLRKKYPFHFLVCVVQRGDEVYIPDGNFVLQSGDRVGITAPTIEGQKLLKQLGILQRQARNVMILGGSRIAYYLAKLLLKSGNAVTVIDKDAARCQELCADLPEAIVVHDDGADQEVLLEEGLRSMDAFVSLTGMDEENILMSFYAVSQKVPKVIAKVNRNELSTMAEQLGLEGVVSPKHLVTDVVSRYARALKNSIGSQVEILYRLMNGRVEALEFAVKADFPCLGVPLREMKLHGNLLIGGILRGRNAFIPTGDDCIQDGDRVIVIAAGKTLDDLSDILR